MRPSNLRVQSALVSAQLCFGLGGVISALGLPACNPFAFALYREIGAGAILLGASAYYLHAAAAPSNNTSSIDHESTVSTSELLSCVLRDWRRFALLGLALFGNQACVIAGIKLAGPVASAVWQPSQPIITAAISMMLGWEAVSSKRVLGVIISFLGCAAMVMMSSASANANSNNDADDNATITAAGASATATKELVGHLLFFLNCLCTSLYVLLSKKPLLVYKPMHVTAWSYTIAAIFMGALAYLVSLSKSMVNFICPDCSGTWHIPSGAIFALLYNIIFNSVVAYFLLTWANVHATGTLVIGYSVLQPVTATLLTVLLLTIKLVPVCNTTPENNIASSTTTTTACLDAPGWEAILGMCGVFAGLALTISTEPTKQSSKQQGEGVNTSDQQEYEKVVQNHTTIIDKNVSQYKDLELT